MKPTLAIAIGALALTGAALAAEPATETVTYKSGAETVTGFLAKPAGAGKHPAIVLIHEWWGLNDWAKSKAKEFAARGYVTLAVDLYRGKVTADQDEAHQLMRGLPEDRATRDLKAAFAYLASRPDVTTTKIGSVGWCMGGGYSLTLATVEPRLAAAAIYYGRLVTDDAVIKGIKAPLLGNFGENDKGIPPDSVRTFEKQAKAAGIPVDFKIYPGAGHAFASNPTMQQHRPGPAKDADTRVNEFFARTLGGSKS